MLPGIRVRLFGKARDTRKSKRSRCFHVEAPDGQRLEIRLVPKVEMPPFDCTLLVEGVLKFVEGKEEPYLLSDRIMPKSVAKIYARNHGNEMVRSPLV